MDMKDRDDAFEAKYTNDTGLKFKVDAHAAKLLASWVGHALKLPTDKLAALETEFVDLNVEKPGFSAICAKAVALLAPENPDATPALIQAKMDALLAQAKHHILHHSH